MAAAAAAAAAAAFVFKPIAEESLGDEAMQLSASILETAISIGKWTEANNPKGHVHNRKKHQKSVKQLADSVKILIERCDLMLEKISDVALKALLSGQIQCLKKRCPTLLSEPSSIKSSMSFPARRVCSDESKGYAGDKESASDEESTSGRDSAREGVMKSTDARPSHTPLDSRERE